MHSEPASPGSILDALAKRWTMRATHARRWLLRSWTEQHRHRPWLAPRVKRYNSLCRGSRRPQLPRCSFNATGERGAKSTTTIDLADLSPYKATPNALPELDYSDALQYPAVVQGAKNNMLKFKNCVLLTRVGNFYEVSDGVPLLSSCALHIPVISRTCRRVCISAQPEISMEEDQRRSRRNGWHRSARRSFQSL